MIRRPPRSTPFPTRRSSDLGRILKELDEQEIIEIGRFFESEGVESVAICFLNSYRNPENEARAQDLMRKHFPNMWVTASVSVLPEIREYERTSTTAVNEIGRAHVWNSSHLGSAYAVFCLKKKK